MVSMVSSRSPPDPRVEALTNVLISTGPAGAHKKSGVGGGAFGAAPLGVPLCTLHLLYSNLVLSRGTCTDSHFPSKSPESPTGKPRALGRVLQSILRWMFSESISDALCPGRTPVHPCISAGSARRDSHPRVPRSPPDPHVHIAKSPAPRENHSFYGLLWFPF